MHGAGCWAAPISALMASHFPQTDARIDATLQLLRGITVMNSEDLLANNVALSGEVSGGLGGELQRAQESLKIALLTIDKLKLELAYLLRMKYGRSSEQLEHAQLELVGGMAPAYSGWQPSRASNRFRI